MSWYIWAGVVLGNFWLLCMVMRVPIIIYETRLFKRAFKAFPFKGSRMWFLVRRVIVPSFLSAPVSLWMAPTQFFRRQTASMIWGVAESLFAEYGPEEEEDPFYVEVPPGEPLVLKTVEAPSQFNRPHNFATMLRGDDE